MNRTDVAYLINTTPQYFYLLPLHVGLIRRYASILEWDIWVATEEPEHPLLKELDVKILTLDKSEGGFLKCREASLKRMTQYKYIVPMQEDFLLERFIDETAISDALDILDTDSNVMSIRLMPCPGPAADDPVYKGPWKELVAANDEYMFTFQACIWRHSSLLDWYTRICTQFEIDYPTTLSVAQRRYAEIRANYAENTRGQGYFNKWLPAKHLAWTRVHKHANAVYMSPWPYRPTAVVNGQLQAWAIDLAKREGFTI
jgi:hypothetical protein